MGKMLLAIDTSTRYAGVALRDEDRTITSLSWYSARNHTKELMPAIRYVLESAGRGPSGLGSIAVALGPGGFSALRVGISTAKGLAMPLGIPILGVGTLEIEAYPYASTGLPICPLLDAGKVEVASAMFRESGGTWTKLKEERVSPVEELIESVLEPAVFCGEGVPHRSEYLRQALGEKGIVMAFHTPSSRLWALGSLAAERLKRGETDTLAALQPLYLRRPSIGSPKALHKVKQ